MTIALAASCPALPGGSPLALCTAQGHHCSAGLLGLPAPYMPSHLCSHLCSFPRAATTNEHNGPVTTAGVYCLTVLEARRLTRSCWQGHAPSEGCREHPSLPLPASGGCWQPLALLSLWQHHSSAFILMWPSSLCLYFSKLSYYNGPSHWMEGSPQASMTSS